MPSEVTIQPNDEHNQKLVSHVHPNDWVNPTPQAMYDMVVIGAGTAGLVTAVASAGLGKKVALIERHLMGGDCLNVGCVPSKALIRSARAAADARSVGEFGVHVDGEVRVDFERVMERMRELRAGIAPHDSADRFTSVGVDVFIGSGRFTGRNTVDVEGVTLNFKKACVATGARAAAPPIPGLDEVEYLTNETIFELTELPKRLLVFGAGAIGCEMAQSFARFGSEVHLLEAQHGIMPREDQACAEIVKASMMRDGVNIHCCGKQAKLENTAGGIRATFESHEQGYDIEVDHVLIAVGRTPNVEGLGLDEAGVKYDKRGVAVDDTLATSNPDIFAAGDICYKYKFTHAADANARIVIRNGLFGWLPLPKAKASKLVMPWCTYTSPEIAHVGKSIQELDEAGTRYETVSVELGKVDRAILEGETEGVLRVHVVPNSGRILGATLVAGHAGEMIGELTMAITKGVKLHEIASVIHPYPTQAEVIKRAGDQFFKKHALNWFGWKSRLGMGK